MCGVLNKHYAGLQAGAIDIGRGANAGQSVRHRIGRRP